MIPASVFQFSLWLAAVGISVVVGYVFYVLGMRGAQPTTRTRAISILETTFGVGKGLEVSFETKRVPRISKTYAFVWNSGRRTLTSEDERVPISFRFEEGTEILQVHIVRRTREENLFEAVARGREIVCSFDYLDRKDGAAIEILHTALFPYPAVEGAFRGVPKGVKEIFPFGVETYFGTKRDLYTDLLFGLAIIGSGVATLMGTPTFPWTGHLAFDAPAFALVALVSSVQTNRLLKHLRRRVPRSIWVSPFEDIEEVKGRMRWYKSIARGDRKAGSA